MPEFIDALGDMCPIPIIKAEKALRKLPPHEEVILETDHSCSIQSVTGHFEDKYNYKCEVEKIETGIWQIKITKTS